MGKNTVSDFEFQSTNKSLSRFEDLNATFDEHVLDCFRCTGIPENTAKPLVPLIDTTGFQQDATGRNDFESGERPDWRMPFVDRKDTVENRVYEHAIRNMSPKEKEAFGAEEQAIQKYNQEFIAWATRNMLNGPEPPDAPDTPMHREISRRVEDLKQKITSDVRSSMSSEELKNLDRAMKQYNREYSEALDRRGSGLMLIFDPEPLPKPPAVVKDYYRRIRESVNRL